MDKRRLQQTGGSSLTVTLPKKWIEQHHLRDKDQVTLFRQASGSLLVKTILAPARTRPATLLLNDLTLDMITRETIALYIAGVAEIEMRASAITREQRAHIRRIAQLLMGFEIVDEAAAKIILRNILDSNKLTIPDAIDKLFLATRSMLEDAVGAALTRRRTLSRDIADRDIEVDKLYLMIKRQFYAALDDYLSEEELQITRTDLNYYRTVARDLERIADHSVKISASTAGQDSMPAKTRRAYQQSLAELLAVMDKARASIHQPDRLVAHEMLNRTANLAITKWPKDTSAASRIILNDSLDRVRGYLMNTAEAIIDQAIRQQLAQQS